MTDLTDLLERASDVTGAPTPVTGDLSRAHAALRRQRRRRGLAAAGTLCAAGVLAGVLGTAVLDDAPAGTPTVVDSEAPDALLFAANESAGPYTFGKLPRGWEVQGSRPQGVTIARVGDDDQEPLSFRGKLVIMFDRNPPSGETTTYDGREFFTRSGGDGHSAVLVRTREGEPEGVVSVQYPDSAGWSADTMIELLGSVTVGDGARPGLG